MAALKPYISLIKSRLKRQPIMFTFNLILGAIASFHINKAQFLFTPSLVLSAVSMIALALSVYIYNDYSDVAIDRLNRLNRPLVKGRVSKNQARNLVTLLVIVGFAAVFTTLNFTVSLLMTIYFILYFLYSFPAVRLKKLFLFNKITVGVGSAMAYLVGGAIFGKIPFAVFLMALYGFLATISTSVVLDFRDMEGDKIYEVKSLPLVWGPVLTIQFVIVLTGLVGIAMVLGYIQLGFHIALTILTACAFATWILIYFPLFKNWNNVEYISKLVWRRLAPIGLILQITTVLGIVL